MAVNTLLLPGLAVSQEQSIRLLLTGDAKPDGQSIGNRFHLCRLKHSEFSDRPGFRIG